MIWTILAIFGIMLEIGYVKCDREKEELRKQIKNLKGDSK
jgi:hypothetical protein